MGWFLLETGEPEAALTEYEIAERLLPATPVVLTHLGHPYFVQRRFKEALNYYEQAVALEPRYLLSQRMIGQVYEATGDLMKAIDAYERGDRESAKNYYEQLREAVQKGGAEGYYRKKLELALAAPEPNSYWIARNYAAWGKMEDAHKWLERALAERNHALADDLMVSLCWDHNDERFKAVARKVGLMH